MKKIITLLCFLVCLYSVNGQLLPNTIPNPNSTAYAKYGYMQSTFLWNIRDTFPASQPTTIWALDNNFYKTPGGVGSHWTLWITGTAIDTNYLKSNYLYKPGLSGGQIASGGTTLNDSLKFQNSSLGTNTLTLYNSPTTLANYTQSNSKFTVNYTYTDIPVSDRGINSSPAYRITKNNSHEMVAITAVPNIANGWNGNNTNLGQGLSGVIADLHAHTDTSSHGNITVANGFLSTFLFNTPVSITTYYGFNMRQIEATKDSSSLQNEVGLRIDSVNLGKSANVSVLIGKAPEYAGGLIPTGQWSVYDVDVKPSLYADIMSYDRNIDGRANQYTMMPKVYIDSLDALHPGTVTMANYPLYINGGGTIMNADTGRAVGQFLTGGMGDKIRDSLQTNINGKVNISDTSSMLTNYLRKTDTSTQMSGYVRTVGGNYPLSFSGTQNRLGSLDTSSNNNSVANIGTARRIADSAAAAIGAADTTAALAPYLRKSDTSTMLLPYVRKTDTSTMLLPYLRKTDTATMLSNRLKISDTATMLSNRLKISDTATMLSPYAQNAKAVKYTDTASMLSTYFKLFGSNTANGLQTFVFRRTDQAATFTANTFVDTLLLTTNNSKGGTTISGTYYVAATSVGWTTGSNGHAGILSAWTAASGASGGTTNAFSNKYTFGNASSGYTVGAATEAFFSAPTNSGVINNFSYARMQKVTASNITHLNYIVIGADTSNATRNRAIFDSSGLASTLSGTLDVPNYYTTSASPGIAAGAGAGTSPTITLATGSTNNDGVITVTTGTLPTLSATVVTLTFSASFAFPNGSSVVLFPANANTSILSGVTAVNAAGTTTTLVITAGATALTAATTYVWNYHVGGY